MSRLRFSQISNTLILTPSSGKATVFLDSVDNTLKAKLDDGSLVILSVTQEYIDDLVANLLQDSITIDFTYNDLTNSLTGEVIQTALDTTLIPNTPSGSISATTVQSAINELDSEKVANTRQVNAGAGLVGGGDLTADRIISMPNVGISGTYGSTEDTLSITTDDQGRITSLTVLPISILSTQISDFNEAAQDAVGSILLDTATVDFVYNDITNEITANVKDGSITNIKIASGVDVTKLSSGVVDNAEFNQLNGVTSPIQDQLDNKQPLDGDLTSISNLASTGLVVRTAVSTMTTRVIEVTSGDLSISNGDGISGNPTLSLPNVGTASIVGAADSTLSITTDTKGRVTSKVVNLISIASSQIADFSSSVLNNLLTGLTIGTNSAIVATDSIIEAFGKLQTQINNHFGVGGSTHPNATTSVSGFMSATDKTKLDGMSGTRIFKSGSIAAASFVGTPRVASVVFSTPFPNTNYSISVLGVNSRSWNFQTKTINGFTINSNSNTALTGEVTWSCISYGETVE